MIKNPDAKNIKEASMFKKKQIDRLTWVEQEAVEILSMVDHNLYNMALGEKNPSDRTREMMLTNPDLLQIKRDSIKFEKAKGKKNEKKKIE